MDCKEGDEWIYDALCDGRLKFDPNELIYKYKMIY